MTTDAAQVAGVAGGRPWLRLLAWLGSLAGMVAVACLLWREWPLIQPLLSQPGVMVAIAVLGMGYGVAQCGPAAMAWGECLGWTGCPVPGFRTRVAWLGRCVLPKYIPGNVAHLGIRALLGTRLGLPPRLLVRATVADIAAQAAPALVLLPLAVLPTVPGWFSTAALLVAAGLLLRRLDRSGQLRRAALWHGLGLIGQATAMALLAAVLCGTGPAPLVWWSAAWVVGFLTPGAPGGLGTREAALIGIAAGLHGMPIEQATAWAAATRLATLLGDLLVAAGTALLPLRSDAVGLSPPAAALES